MHAIILSSKSCNRLPLAKPKCHTASGPRFAVLTPTTPTFPTPVPLTMASSSAFRYYTVLVVLAALVAALCAPPVAAKPVWYRKSAPKATDAVRAF